MEQNTQDKKILGKEVQYSDRIKEGAMNIVKDGVKLFDHVADWMSGVIWHAVKPKVVEDTRDIVVTQAIPVRGVSFNGRQEIIKALPLDTKLTLVPMKNNPADRDAVGIFAGDNQIGYIPAKPIDEWDAIPRILINDKIRKGKHVSINSWFKVGGDANHPKTGVRIRLNIER